jgi:hypothetical protein
MISNTKHNKPHPTHRTPQVKTNRNHPQTTHKEKQAVTIHQQKQSKITYKRHIKKNPERKQTSNPLK